MGKRNQACLWLDEQTNQALLKKQVALAEELDRVPSKSEILRNALLIYLGLTKEENYELSNTPRSISHQSDVRTKSGI